MNDTIKMPAAARKSLGSDGTSNRPDGKAAFKTATPDRISTIAVDAVKTFSGECASPSINVSTPSRI